MIFSSGNVRISDMIKAGLGMKIFGMALILLASMTWLAPVFRIHPLAPLLNNTLLGNSSTSP
jgi:sodium/sulfate cotransporter 1/4